MENILEHLPSKPGERAIVVHVCGELSLQPLGQDQVVITLDQLPELLIDRSVVSSGIAERCLDALQGSLKL